MDQPHGQGFDDDLWGNQHNKPHAKKRQELLLKRRLRELNQENTDFKALLETAQKENDKLLDIIDQMNYKMDRLEEDIVIWKGKALEKNRSTKKPTKGPTKTDKKETKE